MLSRSQRVSPPPLATLLSVLVPPTRERQRRVRLGSNNLSRLRLPHLLSQRSHRSSQFLLINQQHPRRERNLPSTALERRLRPHHGARRLRLGQQQRHGFSGPDRRDIDSVRTARPRRTRWKHFEPRAHARLDLLRRAPQRSSRGGGDEVSTARVPRPIAPKHGERAVDGVVVRVFAVAGASRRDVTSVHGAREESARREERAHRSRWRPSRRMPRARARASPWWSPPRPPRWGSWTTMRDCVNSCIDTFAFGGARGTIVSPRGPSARARGTRVVGRVPRRRRRRCVGRLGSERSRRTRMNWREKNF